MNKKQCFECLEIHNKTWQGTLVQFMIMGCVIGSVVLVCLETMVSADLFYPLLVCNVFFTIELLIRLWRQPTLVLAFTDGGIWIDLICIIPFYLELITDSYKDMLRVFKVLRLFKLARYYNGSAILYRALVDSAVALLVPVYFIISFGTLWSTLIYYFEKDANPESFSSIPATMWFLAVTMTTVGYGDMIPITYGGLWCSLVAMMFGIIFIAMPITMIGTNFTRAWKRKDQWRSITRLRDLFNTPVLVTFLKQQLELYAVDNSIAWINFRRVLQNLVKDEGISSSDILQIFKYFDETGTYEISIAHFLKVTFPNNIERRLQMARMSSRHKSKISPEKTPIKINKGKKDTFLRTPASISSTLTLDDYNEELISLKHNIEQISIRINSIIRRMSNSR